MIRELSGYTKEAFQELGRNANPELTRVIVEDIASIWRLESSASLSPVAVLISGFQGSGKSTTIDVLNKDLNFPVISADEIRYKLLERDINPSEEEFKLQVAAVRNRLLSLVGYSNSSFILDQKITVVRMHLIESILKKSSSLPYSIISILLTAPMEVLRERVAKRDEREGRYKGTLEELEDTVLRHGEFEESRFTRVFHTNEQDTPSISEEIYAMISNFAGSSRIS